jgi:hypothetical protein
MVSAVATSPGTLSPVLPPVAATFTVKPPQGDDDLPPAEKRALIEFGREVEKAARAHCTGVARSTVTTKVDTSRIRVSVRLEDGGSGGLEEAVELEIDVVSDGVDYTVTLWRVDAAEKPRTLARTSTFDGPSLSEVLAELIADQDGAI